MLFCVTRKSSLARAFMALALASLLLAIPPRAEAQDQQAGQKDAETFGDIFVHPRDRSYMPGKAPSRAILEETRSFEDARGRVDRYEYEKNGRVISRETWKDERGESQGRIGIGRKF